MDTATAKVSCISKNAVDMKHMGRAAGRSEMIKFLEGRSLTRGQAIRAMCYSCLGYCEDGGYDCEVKDCPLYPYMPYNKQGAAAAADEHTNIEDVLEQSEEDLS